MTGKTLLSSKYSPTDSWKSIFNNNTFGIFANDEMNSTLNNGPGLTASDAPSTSTTSPLTITVICILIVCVFVVAVLTMMGVHKKLKRRQATASTPDIPLNDLENQDPQPSINFGALAARGNATPRTPTSSKRARVEPPPRLSETTRDLFLVIQEEGNAITVADVTDRDTFGDSGLTLQQRANIAVGDKILFNNSEDLLVEGTVIFKGTEAATDQFTANLSQPGPSTHALENLDNSVNGRLIMFENKLTEFGTRLENSLLDINEKFLKLERRVAVLEGKKNQPTVARNALQAERNPDWKTFVNRVPRVISTLPNYPQIINTKITEYRATSRPINAGRHGDIRELLYQNQAYFTTNYADHTVTGHALMYILVGSNLANRSFLPNCFYTQGPSRTVGQTKPCLSFAATTTFYRALDLLIANIFIPDQRLTYIAKCRNFINNNVDSHRKYPTRRVKTHAVRAYDDGAVFSEAEAITLDFEAEKTAQATEEAKMEIYEWAASIGIENVVEQIPAGPPVAAVVANNDNGAAQDFQENNDNNIPPDDDDDLFGGGYSLQRL